MRRAAFIFIFFTVLFDMLAVGLIVPVLPDLLKSMLGGDTEGAAKTYGLFTTVMALGQFVMSPVLGALSDKVGRRPVVLLSNFGTGLDYVLMAMAPTLPWLFVGRVVAGITSASVATASAYIADVTEPEKRAGAFGMLGAAFAIGFVLGPAAGGMLASVSLRLPFWVAAALSLLNACYGLFVLPESLPAERRRPFSWLRANPVGALALVKEHRALLPLGLIVFLNGVAHWVLPSTFVLYAGARYGWSPLQVGMCLGAVGLSAGVVQGGLVRPLVKRFGEKRMLVTGLLFGAASFVAYGLAPTGGWLLAAIPAASLWGLAGPSAMGLMSQRVGPSEQGRLQGLVGSLQGVAGLLGPLLFTTVFAAALHSPTPGAAFFVAASLMATAAAIGALRVKQLLMPSVVSPTAALGHEAGS